MSTRTVLFVSKPIAPPFHDGAKCLVRDVATSLRRTRAFVLSTEGAPPLEGEVELDRIYPRGGGFAPALADNARVLKRLLFGARTDLWHFVFAPNPASSIAARAAKAVRAIPTVQTVASAPRSFANVERLLFGDRVIALSEWTRERLVSGGADAKRLVVIPPSVSPTPLLSVEQLREVRKELGLGEGPLLVYPGDIEMSQGAPMLAAAAPAIVARVPDVLIVFACRKKTRRADEAETRIRRELAPLGERVKFLGEVPSLPHLLAAASIVAFPVDDLYGKVDLPIALLEAMALGVPIVALDKGPLRELGAALLTPPADASALASACARVLASTDLRAELAGRGRELVATRYRPEANAARYEEIYDELLAI